MSEQPAGSRKKRSTEESRALAREYRKTLQTPPGKRSSPPTSDTPCSAAKKPRRQESDKPTKESKQAQERKSRERAREYQDELARKKPATALSKKASGVVQNGTSGGPQMSSSDDDQYHSDLEAEMANVNESDPAGPAPFLKHPSPSLSSPPVPPPPSTPPMPDVFGVPNLSSSDSPASRPVESEVARNPSAPTIHGRRTTTESSKGQPQGRTRVGTFLIHGTPNEKNAPSAPKAQGQLRSVGPPASTQAQTNRIMVDTPVAHEVPQPTADEDKGSSKRWANLMIALAPLICSSLCFLLWPHVKPHVSTITRSAMCLMPSFAPKTHRVEKCFLDSFDDASICKEGTEVAECPTPAVCGVGSILSCDVPFDVVDGEGCELNAAAKEEADTVVAALRERTIAEQCSGNALILTRRGRSEVTLGEAADQAERKPLSLLASLPPGNVAGIIDVDGEPGSEFGDGSERIARLSEESLKTISFPFGCRVRLWAAHKAMANWKILAGALSILLVIVWRDVWVERRHSQHVQVCSIRDDAYKALLGHAAQSSSPMQVSHIQEFVAGKLRRIGEGHTVSKKRVRKLWSHAEREVGSDSRIRRRFMNVRGQHNVECWEWTGPPVSFETIGAMVPRPSPRIWLWPSRLRGVIA